MAVGCLMAGTKPSKVREVANFCNCKTCSMSAFYNAQKEVIPDIMNVADETVYEARQDSFTTKDETIVSTDACWDNGRNGSNCAVCAIDAETQQTIGYKVVIKEGGKRANVCNYTGPLNMMESYGLRQIAKDFKGDPNCNITKFVHNGDNKCDGVLSEEGFDYENGFGKGHEMKSLE